MKKLADDLRQALPGLFSHIGHKGDKIFLKDHEGYVFVLQEAEEVPPVVAKWFAPETDK